MNRREFCFSLGAAVAGGMPLCSPYCKTQVAFGVAESVVPVSFRAKKFFPLLWRDFPGFGFTSDKIKLLRFLAGNDTVLVVPSLAGMTPEFLKCLQLASLNAGLELYLPADLSPGTMTDLICPLQVTRQSIHSTVSDNGSCDGFLFSIRYSGQTTSSENAGKLCGMILCDASRGTWQTYLCQTSTGQGAISQSHCYLTRLRIAKWLDMAHRRGEGYSSPRSVLPSKNTASSVQTDQN